MHNRCPWTSCGNIQHFLFNLFWSSPEIYFWSPPAFLPLALICCYYVSFSWEYIPSLLVVLSFLYINFIMKNITSEGSWRWKILLRILIIWKVSGWGRWNCAIVFSKWVWSHENWTIRPLRYFANCSNQCILCIIL